MILKLQKKTLVKSQIIGYVITLFIGVFISLVTVQLYFDTKPILQQESGVFDGKTAVVSKQISVLNTIDKGGIYFSKSDIKRLSEQGFCKGVSKFNSASFKVKAYTDGTGSMPKFFTDLFFESIPEEFLDVKLEDWKWDKNQDFLPIIIPESYLKLYNFGFAESQGLPVISKGVISEVGFKVRIEGNGLSKVYNSRIVGFSNKINSILVPQEFLEWANGVYGRRESAKTNRVLIEFNDPSDEAILSYFNESGYTINKDKLEFSKITFFYNAALFFVATISIIIIILSIAFILLSINLIIQKNKKIMQNLYNIGFSIKQIAKFYQMVIFASTVIAVLGSVVFCYIVRGQYLERFKNLFDYEKTTSVFGYVGFILIVLLLVVYNFILMRNIKKAIVS